MLLAIVLMTPWVDHVGSADLVQLGAWAPMWAPPTASATIDYVRLGIEALLAIGITGVAIWMLGD